MTTHARNTRARRVAACALSLALLVPAAAEARRAPIEGRLAASYTVVALAPDGRTRTVRDERGRFRLVPPAQTVTLHLVGSTGRYLGPVVVGGRGGRAVVRVRAGAKLGTLRVRDGYARPGRRVPARHLGDGRPAQARRGVPIGVGVLGRVRSDAVAPGGAGRDRDLDGIPGRYDIDDDGDLVLDVREPHTSDAGRGKAAGVGDGEACPDGVCAGTAAIETSGGDDDADKALAIAVAAAALALVSLLWQIAAALRRRRRGAVEVEARLGLPVYSQRTSRWAVFIEVFNNTDHPVRWVAAALEMKDGRIFYLMEHPPGGELPAVIQPHDSHHTWVDVQELERQGLAIDAPVIAAAKLATGETYHSAPKRLANRRSRFFG